MRVFGWRRRVREWVVASLALGLAGCGGAGVAIEGGAFDASYPLALDVRNPNGSVKVRVRDDAAAPMVRARVRGVGDARPEDAGSEEEAVGVSAVLDRDGERQVLLVNSFRAAWASGGSVSDLEIVLPRCDGVRVINDGGRVRLIGVGGAVTVQNGVATGAASGGTGGAIEVRTNVPVVDPVALVTSLGDVTLVATRGSSFSAEMRTDEGNARFTSATGLGPGVVAGDGFFSGEFNGGASPLVLTTGEGDVRVVIAEDPEGHREHP